MSTSLTRARLPGGAWLQTALVLLAATAASAWAHAPLWRDPTGVVIGPLDEGAPSDLDGTIWFYAWFDRALTHGVPILNVDWTRWPVGETLRNAFPNRIDAWVAWPFTHFFAFPLGFNLFVVAIPVLGTLGAWALLRALGTGAWPAAALALVHGFQRYSFYELAGGRPVTALLVVPPLFLAAWGRALEAPHGGAGDCRRRVGWSLLAGIGASLVAQSYAPWVLWAGGLAAGWALARIAIPAEGVSRWRPVQSAVVAGLAATVLTAPYLHELIVLRDAEGPGGATLWPGDPRAWTETLNWLTRPRLVQFGPAPVPFSANNENTVALDAIWDGAARGAERATLPGGMWVLLLAAVAFGGGGARAWAAAGLLCWLTLAGGRPSDLLDRSPPWVQALGAWLPAPLAPIARAFPAVSEHLRAYRGAPFATLAFAAALALASRHLAARWGSRGAWLAGLLAALLAARTLTDAARIDARAIPGTLWRPSPIYAELARDPDSGAILELPVGFGHAYGPAQAVHHHPRSESAQDTLTVGLGYARDSIPWLTAFRRLGSVTGELPAEDALSRAAADGYRWVMLHRAAYRRTAELGWPLDIHAARAWFAARLGEPVHDDEAVIVFAIPAPAG